MWFPPVELMARNEATAFLLLTWHEMFDAATPDTYQPRLSHSASLVDELLDATERARTSNKWEKHVRVLQEELRHAISTESDLLDEMPSFQWTLTHLSDAKPFRDIASLAKTLGRHKSQFEQHAVHRVRKAVDTLPEQKHAAWTALRTLGTIGVRSAMPPKEFLKCVQEDLFDSSPINVAETLISSISPTEAQFTCYLAVRGTTVAVQQIARKVGFRLVSQADVAAFAEDQFKAVASKRVCVALDLSAPFAMLAVRRASKRLRQAADVYNFHKRAEELQVEPTALAQDTTGKSYLIDLREPASPRLKPRKNAVKMTQEILDADSSRLDGRILNALEHFSLATAGTAPKLQLVNLWSAVECLAGASHGDSIISAVCDVIVPLVTWRRTEKVARYLAACLHEFRSHGGPEEIGMDFPASGHDVSVEFLLLALAKPENHPEILNLLKFSSAHPLLCNRVYSLWTIFHDPQQLLGELKKSYQRTTWNIWRIYRARNLIVHEGVDVPHVPILLNHLHWYFSATLSRILHIMSHNNGWGVEEAIAHWKAKTGYLMESLERAPSRLRINDFVASPKRRGNVQLWP